MPASNYTQTSFLGGEWSPFAQGRIDLPAYKTAMKVCSNFIPLENGALVRRPGFVELGLTDKNFPAKLNSFVTNNMSVTGTNQIHIVELSGDDGGGSTILRVWAQPNANAYPALVSDSNVTVTSFSTASPTLMTTSAATTWNTDDVVYFLVNNTSNPASNGAILMGRQFTLTKVSTTTFTLRDSKDGSNLDGTLLAGYVSGSATAYHVARFGGPGYTFLRVVRALQSGNSQVFLGGDSQTAPWLLTITDSLAITFAALDLTQADGPYLDPLPGSSQQNLKTATVTTADGLTYVVSPGGDGPSFSFAAGDVGKCFRMWYQPPAWVAGTYASGATVTYNGAYWKSTASGNTAVPGQPLVVSGVSTYPWVPALNLGFWVAGHITSVSTMANTANVLINTLEAQSQILTGATLDMWQIGLYGAGHYPACGTWYEGRLWLGGAYKNRLDGSMSGAFDGYIAGTNYLFSPTDKYDNVLDSSAIAEVYYSDDVDDMLWMSSDHLGVVFGTANGIWLIAASTLNDPITPTSIQIHKVAQYKSSNYDPKRVGNSLVFIQAAQNRLYELLVDTFSSKFVGRPLNELADHLSIQDRGIAEICYQEDPVPIIWSITNDGSLLGCTYRRVSNFATEPPLYNGWHRHFHGGLRGFTSFCIGSIVGGLDALAVVTNDPNGHNRVEIMSPIPGPA